MEIIIKSEEKLQLLAAAADEHDEVEFESTEFKHSEKETFETQVREMALQDVMEQKAYYESNLGLQLKAINFFYGGIRQIPRALTKAAISQEIAMGFNGGRAASTSAMAAPIVAPTFDEIEYQTSITVIFEIINGS